MCGGISGLQERGIWVEGGDAEPEDLGPRPFWQGNRLSVYIEANVFESASGS